MDHPLLRPNLAPDAEIDGVPVFSGEAPGPLMAGLVFGCGTRDESFVTIGVTHLAEHLIMSTLPRVHFETNASVSLVETEFTATGRPEQVVSFLRGVCAAMANPPIERLAQEASVIQVEAGFAVHPTAAALLTRRYGARDVGLETYAGPGFDQITAEAVLNHIRTHFVAGNAALWLSGPVPEGLELRLPAGPRVVRTEPVPMARAGAQWSSDSVPGPGLMVAGERSAAFAVGMNVLLERVEQAARHTHGLSYQLGGDTVPVGPVRREYFLGADAKEGSEATVAALIWTEASRLAAEGPTAEEVEHDRAGFEEIYADPRWPAEEAHGRASARILGLHYVGVDERLAEVRALTPADVANCLSAGLRTALLSVPDGVTLDIPGLPEGGCIRTRVVPEGREFAMRTLVGLLARQARGTRLYLTADGIAQRDPDGDVHASSFADVVGVEVMGDDRVVFTADGCTLYVVRDAFRAGADVIRAIDTNVPAHLRFVRSS